MKIPLTLVDIVRTSGVFFFCGCSLLADGPKTGAQFDRISGSETKSIAGSYRDVGTDGSIKPHPKSSGVGGRTDGVIMLGGPAEVPDIKSGQITIKGSMGEKTPTVRMGERTFPSGSGSNSTGSSNEGRGAGGN
jgi:hypothetical protein